MLVTQHKKRFFYGLLLFFIPTSLFASEPLYLKPGLWEESAVIELPNGEIQPLKGTIKRCYTEDYIRGMLEVPTSNEKKGCTVTDYKRSGNKVSWKQKCEKETTTTDEKGQTKIIRWTETDGVWEVTYEGTSFEATLKYDWNVG